MSCPVLEIVTLVSLPFRVSASGRRPNLVRSLDSRAVQGSWMVGAFMFNHAIVRFIFILWSGGVVWALLTSPGALPQGVSLRRERETPRQVEVVMKGTDGEGQERDQIYEKTPKWQNARLHWKKVGLKWPQSAHSQLSTVCQSGESSTLAGINVKLKSAIEPHSISKLEHKFKNSVHYWLSCAKQSQ